MWDDGDLGRCRVYMVVFLLCSHVRIAYICSIPRQHTGIQTRSKRKQNKPEAPVVFAHVAEAQQWLDACINTNLQVCVSVDTVGRWTLCVVECLVFMPCAAVFFFSLYIDCEPPPPLPPSTYTAFARAVLGRGGFIAQAPESRPSTACQCS